mmetsp:Transcript_63394/g.87171  ORF Transcript_63394/g.87171 Transcript_63394/m.87171 type:complete len:190 (-) Transcript_63394:108-677(-)
MHEMLVDHLALQFARRWGLDLRTDSLSLERLHESAESVAKELGSSSSSGPSSIYLPYITADADGPKHLDVKISRAEYSSIVDAALNDVGAVLVRALEAAGGAARSESGGGASCGDVDALLVVGGGARSSVVVSMLERLLVGQNSQRKSSSSSGGGSPRPLAVVVPLAPEDMAVKGAAVALARGLSCIRG